MITVIWTFINMWSWTLWVNIDKFTYCPAIYCTWTICPSIHPLHPHPGTILRFQCIHNKQFIIIFFARYDQNRDEAVQHEVCHAGFFLLSWKIYNVLSIWWQPHELSLIFSFLFFSSLLSLSSTVKEANELWINAIEYNSKWVWLHQWNWNASMLVNLRKTRNWFTKVIRQLKLNDPTLINQFK